MLLALRDDGYELTLDEGSDSPEVRLLVRIGNVQGVSTDIGACRALLGEDLDVGAGWGQIRRRNDGRTTRSISMGTLTYSDFAVLLLDNIKFLGVAQFLELLELLRKLLPLVDLDLENLGHLRFRLLRILRFLRI